MPTLKSVQMAFPIIVILDVDCAYGRGCKAYLHLHRQLPSTKCPSSTWIYTRAANLWWWTSHCRNELHFTIPRDYICCGIVCYSKLSWPLQFWGWRTQLELNSGRSTIEDILYWQIACTDRYTFWYWAVVRWLHCTRAYHICMCNIISGHTCSIQEGIWVDTLFVSKGYWPNALYQPGENSADTSDPGRYLRNSL